MLAAFAAGVRFLTCSFTMLCDLSGRLPQMPQGWTCTSANIWSLSVFVFLVRSPPLCGVVVRPTKLRLTAFPDRSNLHWNCGMCDVCSPRARCGGTCPPFAFGLLCVPLLPKCSFSLSASLRTLSLLESVMCDHHCRLVSQGKCQKSRLFTVGVASSGWLCSVCVCLCP